MVILKTAIKNLMDHQLKQQSSNKMQLGFSSVSTSRSVGEND